MISGIIHMLRCGGRWQGCPPEYGRATIIYNRWNRWSRRGLWQRLFAALSAQGRLDVLAMLDSTDVKAHRSAQGGKGGPRRRRSASRVATRPPKFTPSAIFWAVPPR